MWWTVTGIFCLTLLLSSFSKSFLLTGCSRDKTIELRDKARIVAVEPGNDTMAKDFVTERLKSDHKILLSLASTVRKMEVEMTALQKSVGLKERGHFTSEEHDAIVGLLFRYLVCREALWDMLAFYSDQRKNFAKESDQAKGFVIGLSAALHLHAYSGRLVETFLNEPEVIAKINEGNFRFNIPEGVYDQIFQSVTSVEHQEALRTAWALFNYELFDDETALYHVNKKDSKYEALIVQCRQLYNVGVMRMEAILEARSIFLPDIRNRLRHTSIVVLVKKAKSEFGKNLFAAQGVLFSQVSDLKNPLASLIEFTPDQEALIFEKLQPGDLLFTFTEGYMSNVFLPGVFKHGITYIGSPQERKDMKLDQLLRGDLPKGVRERYLEDLKRETLPNGKSANLIEAVAEGVIFNSLETILDTHINRLLVLRPLISAEERSVQLQRVFELRGDDYDYDFDFHDASSQCCTEVIYRSLNKKGNIDLTLVPRFGRQTLSADDVIIEYLSAKVPAFKCVILAEKDPTQDGSKAFILEGEAGRNRLLAMIQGSH